MPLVPPVPWQYSHGPLCLPCHPWGQEVLLALGSLCHPGADEMAPSAPSKPPPITPLHLGTARSGGQHRHPLRLMPSCAVPPPQPMAVPQGVPAQSRGAQPEQGYLLSNTSHAGSLGEKQRGWCWALPTAPCSRAGAGREGPAGQHHLPACRVVPDRPAERRVSLPAPSPAAPHQPAGIPLHPYLLPWGSGWSRSSLCREERPQGAGGAWGRAPRAWQPPAPGVLSP